MTVREAVWVSERTCRLEKQLHWAPAGDSREGCNYPGTSLQARGPGPQPPKRGAYEDDLG